MIDVPVGVRKRTGPRASLHLITADALRSAPRRSEKECNLIGFEAFYKWNGSSWGHPLIWSWTLEEFRSVLWIVIVLHGWVAVGTGRRWHDVCCTSVRETSRVTSAASRGVGDWIRGDTVTALAAFFHVSKYPAVDGPLYSRSAPRPIPAFRIVFGDCRDVPGDGGPGARASGP